MKHSVRVLLFTLVAAFGAALSAQAQTTYALGNWTVTAKQDKGVKRLYNKLNAGLVDAAISAGTAINAGGSGYHVNDVLTLTDTGTTTTAATFKVTAVDGAGAVTAIAVVGYGDYTSHQNAANHATTVAPLGGTGCVIRVNYYSDVPNMVVRNGGLLDNAAFSYSAQLEQEVRDAIGAAVSGATDTQLNNAASALGVTLPK